MILITGGVYQGKLSAAKVKFKQINGERKPLVLDADSGSLEQMLNADIIYNLHLFIKRLLEEEKDPHPVISSLTEQNKNVIFTVAELGCGVVPIDKFDRNYREVTGRICCELAQKSTEVIRVLCGISTVIYPKQTEAVRTERF